MANMINQDGAWESDGNGIWTQAIPLPYYRSKLFLKPYKCQCGVKFYSERHYRLHYFHEHTDQKLYKRTPKGLVEVSDLGLKDLEVK